MTTPLQITFRGMDRSAAVEADIQHHVDKLEQVYDRITRCRVVIESPHKHHRHGRLFKVCVAMAIPGKEIVAGRSHDSSAAHEDLYVAVHDAFRAARRLLDGERERRLAS